MFNLSQEVDRRSIKSHFTIMFRVIYINGKLNPTYTSKRGKLNLTYVWKSGASIEKAQSLK